MLSVVSSLVRSIASSTVLGAGGAAVSEPAEFIVNGGFATDTDWTKGAGWTIAAGVAANSGTSGTLVSAAFPQALIPGQSYTLSVLFGNALLGSIIVRLLPSAQTISNTALDGAQAFPFTASAADTQVRFSCLDAVAYTLDNVSLVP